jgi:hypothetical protein
LQCMQGALFVLNIKHDTDGPTGRDTYRRGLSFFSVESKGKPDD